MNRTNLLRSNLFSLAVVLGLGGAAVALGADNQKGKEKLKPYPLDTCVVSGEKLGEMGKPVVIGYEGREIKFCCADCPKTFKKDPAKYLKKIDEAAAKKSEKNAAGDGKASGDRR